MSEPIQCTKENPWSPVESRPGVRVQHKDARAVTSREYHDTGDEVVTYECPHCLHRFDVEIPQ